VKTSLDASEEELSNMNKQDIDKTYSRYPRCAANLFGENYILAMAVEDI